MRTFSITWFVARFAVALAAGCGVAADTSAPFDMFASTPDLSVDHPLDGGAVDLSRVEPPVYDLAWSACAGTKLAGTCVERFFEPFVACFQPAGHCDATGSQSGFDDCWQSGASFGGTYFGYPRSRTWAMGKNVCLIALDYPPSLRQFCTAGDPSCVSMRDDGGSVVPTPGGARYDSQTGIFTCTDGTQVDIGTNFGGCTVLDTLLDPSPLCDKTSSACSPR
jgi:hypothetical protein